jgi:hypothetical protein
MEEADIGDIGSMSWNSCCRLQCTNIPYSDGVVCSSGGDLVSKLDVSVALSEGTTDSPVWRKINSVYWLNMPIENHGRLACS